MIKSVIIGGCVLGAVIALTPNDGGLSTNIHEPLQPIRQQSTGLPPVPGPFHPIIPAEQQYAPSTQAPPAEVPSECAQGIINCGVQVL